MAPARLRDLIAGEKYTHSQTVSVFEKWRDTGPGGGIGPESICKAVVGLCSVKTTVDPKRRFADHARGVDLASQKPVDGPFPDGDNSSGVGRAGSGYFL
jgi:hypothetical protein